MGWREWKEEDLKPVWVMIQQNSNNSLIVYFWNQRKKYIGCLLSSLGWVNEKNCNILADLIILELPSSWRPLNKASCHSREREERCSRKLLRWVKGSRDSWETPTKRIAGQNIISQHFGKWISCERKLIEIQHTMLPVSLLGIDAKVSIRYLVEQVDDWKMPIAYPWYKKFQIHCINGLVVLPETSI